MTEANTDNRPWLRLTLPLPLPTATGTVSVTIQDNVKLVSRRRIINGKQYW